MVDPLDECGCNARSTNIELAEAVTDLTVRMVCERGKIVRWYCDQCKVVSHGGR